MMINWFKKDKRTVITDTDRPLWFKRVNSLDEAKAYIDECRGKRSMSAFNESYYAAYSIEGNWVVVDKKRYLG